LTAVRQRAVRKAGGPNKDDFFAIEIHELDKKIPFSHGDLIPDSRFLPPPFDFERLTRFMAYGFLMAPIQHKWFGFLSSVFPLTKSSGTVAALKRVAFDQLIFAPVGKEQRLPLQANNAKRGAMTDKDLTGLAVFFTYMTVAEGGGKRAITRKFQDVYIPALKANYMVWPMVQMINFRMLPLQFQIVRPTQILLPLKETSTDFHLRVIASRSCLRSE
jgi:hypothetical protein